MRQYEFSLTRKILSIYLKMRVWENLCSHIFFAVMDKNILARQGSGLLSSHWVRCDHVGCFRYSILIFVTQRRTIKSSRRLDVNKNSEGSESLRVLGLLKRLGFQPLSMFLYTEWRCERIVCNICSFYTGYFDMINPTVVGNTFCYYNSSCFKEPNTGA